MGREENLHSEAAEQESGVRSQELQELQNGADSILIEGHEFFPFQFDLTQIPNFKPQIPQIRGERRTITPIYILVPDERLPRSTSNSWL